MSEKYFNWVANGCCEDTSIENLFISDHKTPTSCENIPNIKSLKNLSFVCLELKSIASIGNIQYLESLYICEHTLTSLPEEIGNLQNLKTLILTCHKLTSIPVSIGRLQNLQMLDVSCDKITTIPSDIGNLTNLEIFFICGEHIEKIPVEIGNLIGLKVLMICCNIHEIPDSIWNLQNLEELDFSSNSLMNIPSAIGNLHNLQSLFLIGNQLEHIPEEIGNLTKLESLQLMENGLITIPAAIGNLPNLQYFDISDNPIEYLPPNVRRLVDRHRQGVYQDSQSVHNSTIQKSIKASIMRLVSIKPTIESDKVLELILTDHTLTPFTKESIVEYARNIDLISEVNVTFLEVLTSVWNRIMTNEYSTDIKNVLNDEMKDSECKCFTGHVSRLVNCLSGFDSLVEVSISDNEQIGNVIAVIGDRLKYEKQYTVEIHKDMVHDALKELGYNDEIIGVWLDYIE